MLVIAVKVFIVHAKIYNSELSDSIDFTDVSESTTIFGRTVLLITANQQ